MNDKKYFEDIIFARATPSGASSIASIRVSGQNSWKILKNIFKSNKNVNKYKSHRIYYGDIKDNNNKIIDNVVILTFGENKSFTGEESFEINCHGSEVIISLIFRLLLSLGLRIAEPGEFSKRAFLNNKINLLEAESIMDIVKASTEKSALVAMQQLSGKLTYEINSIKDNIKDLLSEIEVDIDYPEEDISIDTEKWNNKIESILNKIDLLISSFQRGHFFRENIQAVILGKTNTGKSTLFNFLLNEDKAIVSDIHGTTRDYLDGIINIKGYGVRLFDTAGLRESKDPIEIEGSKRSINLSSNANIILYVTSLQSLDNEDINKINDLIKDKKVLCIINKIDIDNKNNEYFIKLNETTKINKNIEIIKMSALKKIGLENFNNSFLKLLTDNIIIESDDPIITNSRHAELLELTINNIKNSIIKINEELLDLAAFEIREALDRLGEITGEITSTDVINNIFSNFCVGK